MAAWFYSKGKSRIGPVEWDELVRAAREGALSTDDLVWANGMAEWSPASRISGLFSSGPPPLPSQVGTPPANLRPPQRLGDDPMVRMLLPVGRSGWAIAAGYLGLFSILAIFAPFALLTGILAIRDIRANPEKHGMGRAIFGIVMGALGTGILLLFIFSKYMRRY